MAKLDLNPALRSPQSTASYTFTRTVGNLIGSIKTQEFIFLSHCKCLINFIYVSTYLLLKEVIYFLSSRLKRYKDTEGKSKFSSSLAAIYTVPLFEGKSMIPLACVSFQNVHFFPHLYPKSNVSSMFGWETSVVVFGMELRRPLIVFTKGCKAGKIHLCLFCHLWSFSLPFPTVLLTLTWPFLPREKQQLQTLPAITFFRTLPVSQGAVSAEKLVPAKKFMRVCGLMSYLFHKTCLHFNKGLQSKYSLNNEDFRCFVMTDKQGSFFSPKKDELWLFLPTTPECQASWGYQYIGHLQLSPRAGQ